MKFMVRCDREAFDFLKKEIEAAGIKETKATEVKGLGGEIEQFVVAGTVTLEAVAALLKVIAEAISLRKAVKSVKLVEKEVVNPTKEQVEELDEESSG